eukprot:8767584-Karenia_brevis.AAC.1
MVAANMVAMAPKPKVGKPKGKPFAKKAGKARVKAVVPAVKAPPLAGAFPPLPPPGFGLGGAPP